MMHADEVATDATLVRRLLAAQFPAWADFPIEQVASAGTDNALYRLGDDMVVRLPRIQWAVKDVEKEREWLPRIAPLLPLAIPVPLGSGEPAEGFPWPWSVYRWLPGENPSVEPGADADSLAPEVARFVAALHRVDPADGPPAGRGIPLGRRDAPTRAAIGALQEIVDTIAVTAAWDAALQAPAWPGPPVWVHGDLSAGNLLTVDGRLSAVIDFGGLGVGDPACDLIVAWDLFSAEARKAFREALGVDDATWERGRGWALSTALIALPYYRDTNPAIMASARRKIAAVLADHAGTA
jgi:aminoglycoside phosphotransferase (APT) family kinase protein